MISTKDSIEMIDYFFKNKMIFIQENREIQGLVKNSKELDFKKASQLRSVNPNLVKDFVIIEEGGEPSWRGFRSVLTGLAILFFLFISTKRVRKK